MNNIDNINNIDTLCLSCGGVKCLAFLGSLYYLIYKMNFDISKINKFYGTSGGALLNFCLIIGYNIIEITDFIFELDLSKLVNYKLDFDDLINNNGFDKGEKIIYVIQELLYLKLSVKSITFQELYILTNKELYIFGTNFTKGIERCFSHKTTPNMDVILALRITLSIPYLLYPVLFENDYYIDGAVVNSFPIDYCNQDKTLGIYIKYNVFIKNKINIFDIYKTSLNIITDTLVENKFKNLNNIITIISDSKNNVKGITNLNIKKDYKIKIFKLGYICTCLHFSKYL